jgi:steroid delta-isomerase-like uncharacterized protein
MSPFDLCRRYIDAWNRHDADAILRCFALGGRYCDPTTGRPISGAGLKAHAEGLWRAFSDLHWQAEAPIGGSADRVVLPWTMTGTNDGARNGLAPTHRQVSVQGLDLLQIVAEGIASATGYFDPTTVPRQLGQEVVVQPREAGPVQFGISRIVRTGRPIDEGAVGITELVARSDEEIAQVQELGDRIALDLHDKPGFISLTTSTAGRRLTTMSSWDSVRSLRQSMIGNTHAEAMRRFLGSDLFEGGAASVWLRVSANAFRRCPQCTRMRRISSRTERCECGGMLEMVA